MQCCAHQLINRCSYMKALVQTILYDYAVLCTSMVQKVHLCVSFSPVFTVWLHHVVHFNWSTAALLCKPKSRHYCKDKDKEALFNVADNVTNNISSRAILRHNDIFNRYLPALLYLPITTPFMQASAREVLVPFLHLWYGAAAGFEPKTSRSESGRSTNWAIEAVTLYDYTELCTSVCQQVHLCERFGPDIAVCFALCCAHQLLNMCIYVLAVVHTLLYDYAVLCTSIDQQVHLCVSFSQDVTVWLRCVVHIDCSISELMCKL